MTRLREDRAHGVHPPLAAHSRCREVRGVRTRSGALRLHRQAGPVRRDGDAGVSPSRAVRGRRAGHGELDRTSLSGTQPIRGRAVLRTTPITQGARVSLGPGRRELAPEQAMSRRKSGDVRPPGAMSTGRRGVEPDVPHGIRVSVTPRDREAPPDCGHRTPRQATGATPNSDLSGTPADAVIRRFAAESRHSRERGNPRACRRRP
jgi:hypothetical protein